MSDATPITFVVPVKTREILQDNFLTSPCFHVPHPHQILIQEGFSSAARAYNDAMDRSANDLMVFAHQDLILSSAWPSELERALESLEVTDPQWGVLGCYGVTVNNEGRGHAYTSGYGILGAPFDHPVPVQTLDEMVLILRKSSGLRFNERLPHFHLFGADICMAAAKRNRKSYAISAFCIHNTNENFVLAREFYECYRHLKGMWRDHLPIQTTCIRVTKFDLSMYKRRLWEAYLRYICGREFAGIRTPDVPMLLKRVEALLAQRSATGSVS